MSRTSDVLPKVVTSYDIRTSSTLPRGKSPTVQQMGEFCTLGVANGRSDRWKSAHPSASPFAGRLPGRRHSRPPGGRLFFPRSRPPTRPHAGRRRPSLRASAQEKEPSAWPSTWRMASSVPRPSTAHTVSCLISAPGSPPPPLTVFSTVEFQVSIKIAAQTPSVCFRTYVSQEL